MRRWYVSGVCSGNNKEQILLQQHGRNQIKRILYHLNSSPDLVSDGWTVTYRTTQQLSRPYEPYTQLLLSNLGAKTGSNGLRANWVIANGSPSRHNPTLGNHFIALFRKASHWQWSWQFRTNGKRSFWIKMCWKYERKFSVMCPNLYDKSHACVSRCRVKGLHHYPAGGAINNWDLLTRWSNQLRRCQAWPYFPRRIHRQVCLRNRTDFIEISLRRCSSPAAPSQTRMSLEVTLLASAVPGLLGIFHGQHQTVAKASEDERGRLKVTDERGSS